MGSPHSQPDAIRSLRSTSPLTILCHTQPSLSRSPSQDQSVWLVVQKLDELKEEFGEGSEEAMGTSSREGKAGSPGDSPALQGLQDLQVIVGRGRRSVGGPQLKATATATLKAMGLDAEQVCRSRCLSVCMLSLATSVCDLPDLWRAYEMENLKRRHK